MQKERITSGSTNYPILEGPLNAIGLYKVDPMFGYADPSLETEQPTQPESETL